MSTSAMMLISRQARSRLTRFLAPGGLASVSGQAAVRDLGPPAPAEVPSTSGRKATFFESSAPASSKFSQRRLVGWSPEEFCDVVCDVDKYHLFVPWCQKSRVTIGSKLTPYMEAELEVGFNVGIAITERYTSKVTIDRPKAVRSRVVNSLLFHHLDSSWRLDPGPTPHTCWLTFDIDFAFQSRLYSTVADMFLSEVAKKMVEAFEGRCQQLHGPSSLVRPRSTPPAWGASTGGRTVGSPSGAGTGVSGRNGRSS